MSTTDDNYIGILLEEIRDQNRALLEAAANQATRDDITQLRDDVSAIKSDIKVIKAAVTDQSKQLNDHDHHITRLEAA